MSDREYPEQSYYPSCKVRLFVRFEEFELPLEGAPTTISTRRKGNGEGSSNDLEYVREGDALELRPKGGGQAGDEQSSDGLTHVLEGIIPESASVSRGDTRTSDTLNLTFKYDDLPLNPLAIRKVAVQCFMGSVSPEEFQQGINGATDDRGTPLNVVPDTYVDPGGNERSNKRFSGYVDDWSIVWTDDTPMISMVCTANDRLLFDQEAPSKLSIDPKLPIDQAVAGYLSNFPHYAGIKVLYLPTGDTPPIFKEATAKNSFMPKLGPPPSRGGGSVMDYIKEVCEILAHSVYFDGDITLIIQPTRALIKGGARRPDDPYVPRRLPSGTVLKNRTMVYGRNIAELSVSRNFSAFEPKNIEVRSYLGERKKTLVTRYPVSKNSRLVKALPGNKNDQEWTRIEVPGVKDKATLRKIAQQAYENLGRRQLTVNVSTENLASYGGGWDDTDLLDLRTGDPVDVEINRSEEQINSLNSIEDTLLVPDRIVAFLVSLGYSEEFSTAYSNAYSNVHYQSTFRVVSASFDWGIDSGISISLEATSYVEIRADVSLEGDEEPAIEEQQEVPPRTIDV